jgi:hypothetical protein
MVRSDSPSQQCWGLLRALLLQPQLRRMLLLLLHLRQGLG